MDCAAKNENFLAAAAVGPASTKSPIRRRGKNFEGEGRESERDGSQTRERTLLNYSHHLISFVQRVCLQQRKKKQKNRRTDERKNCSRRPKTDNIAPVIIWYKLDSITRSHSHPLAWLATHCLQLGFIYPVIAFTSFYTQPATAKRPQPRPPTSSLIESTLATKRGSPFFLFFVIIWLTHKIKYSLTLLEEDRKKQ